MQCTSPCNGFKGDRQGTSHHGVISGNYKEHLSSGGSCSRPMAAAALLPWRRSSATVGLKVAAGVSGQGTEEHRHPRALPAATLYGLAEFLQHRGPQDPHSAVRPPLLWRHSERITQFLRAIKVLAGATCDSTQAPAPALPGACPFNLFPAHAP